MLDEKTIQLTNYYDIKHEAICACCLLMKRLRYIFPPSPLKVAVRGSGEGVRDLEVVADSIIIIRRFVI